MINVFAVIGYPLLVIAGLGFFLGLVLLFQNPRRNPLNTSTAILFFAAGGYSLFAGLSYVLASMNLNFDFTYRASWVGWIAIPALFHSVHILKNRKKGSARYIAIFFYFFWTAVLGLCLFTDYVERGAVSLTPFVDNSGPLEDLLRLTGTVLFIWIVYDLFLVKQKSVGLKKAQLSYFLLGTLIYALGSALPAGIHYASRDLGVDPVLGAYFTLPWLLLVFYGITNYRLFDIHLVISGSIAAFSLFVGLALVHIGLFQVLEPSMGPSMAIIISLLVLTMVLFITPLRNGIRQGIDRLILGRKYEAQEILKESVRAIVTILDPDELLRYIIDIVRKNMGVEKLCIFMKKTDGRFQMIGNWGIDEKTASAFSLPEGLIERLTNTGLSFLREEIERDLLKKDLDAIMKDMDKIGAELIIPLFFKRRITGVLTLSYKRMGEPFTPGDIAILETFARHTAIAMENARLYEEATSDDLTRVLHRKFFSLRVKEELKRSLRHKHPLSLIMIAIDDIQTIKERFGHEVEDEVLSKLGQVFLDRTRGEDVAARFSGNEFCLLLPETPGEKALVLAERLRELMGEIEETGDGGVAVSIGIVEFDGENKDIDETQLLDKAKETLLQAREQGENKIVLIT